MAKATYVRGQDDLTDAILKCRTWSHAWDDFYPEMPPPAYGWRESVRCMRCTTERHRIINRRTGAIESVEYRYPDGYRFEPGSGHVGRADFRNTMFERLRDRLEAARAIAPELTVVKGKAPAKRGRGRVA